MAGRFRRYWGSKRLEVTSEIPAIGYSRIQLRARILLASNNIHYGLTYLVLYISCILVGSPQCAVLWSPIFVKLAPFCGQRHIWNDKQLMSGMTSCRETQRSSPDHRPASSVLEKSQTEALAYLWWHWLLTLCVAYWLYFSRHMKFITKFARFCFWKI